MANKEMKTLTMGGNTYEIVDQSTRDRVDILEDNQLVMTDNGNGEVNLTTTNISMIDGSLSESSTNAIQNRAVTAAINNHTTKINDNANNIAVQKARIDTFTTLASGSTTGDAELIDIRVKADGTTATSAGNAVREQISELKSDLGDLNDAMKEVICKGLDFYEPNKHVNALDGSISKNENTNVSGFIDVSLYNYISVEMITAISQVDVGGAFYTDNSVFVDGIEAPLDTVYRYKRLIVKVPQNAHYFRCTFWNGRVDGTSPDGFEICGYKIDDTNVEVSKINKLLDNKNLNKKSMWSYGSFGITTNIGAGVVFGCPIYERYNRAFTIKYINESIGFVFSKDGTKFVVWAYDSGDNPVGIYDIDSQTFIDTRVSPLPSDFSPSIDFIEMRNSFPNYKFKLVYMGSIDNCIENVIIQDVNGNGKDVRPWVEYTNEKIEEITKRKTKGAFSISEYLGFIDWFTKKNSGVSYEVSSIDDVDVTTFDWVGGVVVDDHKVLAIPNHGTFVLEIDTLSNSYTFFGENIPSGNFKWTSGCMTRDGLVYAYPRSSNYLLEINPKTYETKLIDIGLNYSGEHHYGGTLVGNKIYLNPRLNHDLLIVDLDDFSVESVQLPLDHYSASILHPNGFIYIIPQNNGNVLKFNPNTNTYDELSGTDNWSCFGCVVASDGNIYGYKSYSDGMMKIDVQNNTATTIHTEIGRGWYGTLMGINGKLYSIVGDSTKVYEYDVKNDMMTQITTLSQEDNEAKCAGGVTMSDGTMCMIPAKGDCIYMFKPTNMTSKRNIPSPIVRMGTFNNY